MPSVLASFVFEMPAPYLIIQAAWIAFCVYWIWAARNQKREQKREPPLARLLHVAYMACGFILLYAQDPRFGALNRRFLPEREWIAVLGAVLTAAGSGLCNLGAPAHRKKLERPGYHPQRARAHPHRSLRANPPSDLYRSSVGRGRHSNRDRRVSRDCGLCSSRDRLCSESETRRGFSRDAVRPCI